MQPAGKKIFPIVMLTVAASLCAAWFAYSISEHGTFGICFSILLWLAIVIVQAFAEARMGTLKKPPPSPPTFTSPENFREAEWLNYYSQVREFQASVAQKFVTLITQASIFATAVCAACATLHQSHPPDEAYLAIAICTCLALSFYWFFIYRYFWQIRGCGDIMLGIEIQGLKLSPDYSILQKLRQPGYAFYGTPQAKFFVSVYPLLLMLAVAATALILCADPLCTTIRNDWHKIFPATSQPTSQPIQPANDDAIKRTSQSSPSFLPQPARQSTPSIS